MSKKAFSSLLFNVHVRPNAKINAIREVNRAEQLVRCDIAADAQNGQANGELLDYFKGIFKVSSSEIELVRGHKQRDKVVRLHSDSLSLDDAFARLNEEKSS